MAPRTMDDSDHDASVAPVKPRRFSMHRLRKGKKNRVDDDAPPVPELPLGKLGKKSKKGHAHPEPETPTLDLENALPASDDFRTSLLMPNLANRFSILKQQEAAAAAAAAAGQANGESAPDGALAYPPHFAAGLGDIAETSSMHGSSVSIDHGALTSRSDDTVNEGGSVMNRSRGGDGNVLFGGRQKVYRVRASKTLRGGTSSMEDLRRSDSPLGGRVAYDQDMPPNFSRRTSRRATREAEETAEENDDDNAESPAESKRYTASSTNSSTPTAFTRSSTAATSIHSQGGYSGLSTSNSTPAIPTSPTASTKPRRALYEQALDQQLQEQTTTMGRLERLASMRKHGTSSPAMASYSTRSLSGRLSDNSSTPTSPTSEPETGPGRAWPKRPLSPLLTPNHEEEPAEEEKPKKSPGVNLGFDFGLEPRSLTPISPPISSCATEFPTQGPFAPKMLRAGSGTSTPDRSVSPVPRASTERSRSPRPSLSPDDAFDRPDGSEPPGSAKDRSTFLSISSASSADGRRSTDSPAPDSVIDQIQKELDSANELMVQANAEGSGSRRNTGLPLMDSPTFGPTQHHKAGGSIDSDIVPAPLSPQSPIKNQNLSPSSPKFATDDDDSPTLPPGQGLSVLVRQHLRSDSGSSSYAGSVYTRYSRISRYVLNDPKLASVYGMPLPAAGVMPSGASGSSAGNIWEFENYEGQPKSAPPVPSSPKSFLSSASVESNDEAVKDGEQLTASPFLSPKGEEALAKKEHEWEKDRQRALSPVETNDDDDWEQQLATRRKMIEQNIRNQEKISSIHEAAFDANEELPTPKSSGLGGAFNVLKPKSSNGFLRGEGGSKTAPNSRPQSRNKNHGESRSPREEDKRHREPPRGPHPLSQHPAHQSPPGRPRGPQKRPSAPQLRTNLPPPSGHPSEALRAPPGPPGSRSAGPSPRMRQRPSHETLPRTPRQGRSNSQSATNSPRTVRSERSPPDFESRVERMNFNDDLSRAMMTGQSRAIVAESSSPQRHRSRDQNPLDSRPVTSSFDLDEERPTGTFRRTRSSSVVRQTKLGLDVPPLPNSATLPSNRRPSDESPSSALASPAVRNPEAIVKTINASNAMFQGAKKRSVSKHQIGEPKLLSKTSSVPTVDIVPRPTSPLDSPLLSPMLPGKSSRRRTNTIFGSLAKSKSSEAVPALPSPGGHDADEKWSPFTPSRLKKSASDGGGLSSRARAEITADDLEHMPKLHPMAAPVPMTTAPRPGGLI